MSSFENKLAVITGAAGNLGQAVAAGLHEAGARCVLVDINQERLQELYADWADTLLVPANLMEEESVQAMVRQVAETWGAIDILANIAGGFRMGPTLQDTDVSDWEFMMNLNARTVFLTCKAAIPGMLESGGGRIINVSARAADAPKGKMAPYCASKGAVLTFTQALAAENKHTGINVNCILPGTIDTPENRADMPDADFSTWVQPRELADTILYLASDQASAVTGAAIPVYGRS